MSTIQVLCVENEPRYLDILQTMLKATGYQVVSATTGVDALALFAQHPVHGVLLEYDLPDVIGSVVRSEMKRIKPEIPVLLFSGVGKQTAFLIRFFDSYLRNTEKPDWAYSDLDS